MNIKIQKYFIQWAFNEPFPTNKNKYNRIKFLHSMLDENKIDRDTLQYWLQEAFHEGARAQQKLSYENQK
jgi:hypothetical protein